MGLMRFTKEELELYKYYATVIDKLQKGNKRVTIQDIVDYTSFSTYKVISDLTQVRLIGRTHKSSSNNPQSSSIMGKGHIAPEHYKRLTEEREYLYEEYFFKHSPENRPTLSELASLVGKSKGIVAKDLRYFEYKYNCKFPIVDDGLPVQNLSKHSSTKYALSMDEMTSMIEEVCSDDYFERVSGYLEYIRELGYIPTKTDFYNKFGVDKKQLAADLHHLGLKCITQFEYYDVFRKPTEQRALEHEDFYREHYFESDCPLSLDEMAELLGEFRQVVNNEIQYLNQKYKVNPKCIKEKRREYINKGQLTYYKDKIEEYFNKKGYIPSEHITASELDLSPSIIHMAYQEFSYRPTNNFKAITLEKEREPFYREHYFESPTPMTYAEMGKILNIGAMTVWRNIFNLKEKYACSEIDDKCEAYQKLKGDLDYDERLAIRKGIYKSMLKYNKHYRIKHLCNLFGCHYDVIALDMQKVPILSDIVIK